MINITDKSHCCGCWACANVCPKQCISMRSDIEGFTYPSIDTSSCINCDLCEKVCPELNKFSQTNPQAVYAGWSCDDNIRYFSSSGGVFTILARSIIDCGGIVFGAKFDHDWSVIHSFCDDYSGISAFRGSKYVQSTIGSNYKKAKEFLEQGREVLFSGTPCQISGLRHYLRKDYPNLTTLDVVCHGVPSQLIFKKYLKSAISKSDDVSDINFRDKSSGWKKFSVTIKSCQKNITKSLSQEHIHNPYMQSFLSDLALRPSCYNCPTKNGTSGSDITIGDFWGIDKISPELDDDKGCNLIMINTLKGQHTFNRINLIKHPSSIEEAVRYNKCITQSVARPTKRQLFMDIAINYGFDLAHRVCFSRAIIFRAIRFVDKIISR